MQASGPPTHTPHTHAQMNVGQLHDAIPIPYPAAWRKSVAATCTSSLHRYINLLVAALKARGVKLAAELVQREAHDVQVVACHVRVACSDAWQVHVHHCVHCTGNLVRMVGTYPQVLFVERSKPRSEIDRGLKSQHSYHNVGTKKQSQVLPTCLILHGVKIPHL